MLKSQEARTQGSAAFAPLAGEPRQTVGMKEVIALTVGVVVGAGIFRASSLVAEASGSAEAFLLAWLFGGALSIVGALCYAELASAEPSIGGDYHFLGRAFGHRLAFLYAWARFSVIQSGSIALLAFIFGDYATQLFNLGPLSSALYGALVVVAVTLLNWVGIRFGTRAQNWLTVCEVLGLVLVIVAGLLLAPAAEVVAAPRAETAWGLAMIFVLLTFGGWNEAVYLSAEMRDGRRKLGWAMIAGLLVVTALYLLVNAAYLRSLSLPGVAATDAVAADVMSLAFGPAGAATISLLIGIAALTSANATAMTGARTTCALGRNYPALRWLGHWDERRGTPANALIAQGFVALLLVAGGAFSRDGFEAVVEYSAPVFWFFFLLVGISLFVLRRRYPHAERPFRVPLYPVLPAVFCLTCAYLLYSSIAYTGPRALIGIAVVAFGGVLMLFLRAEPEEKS